MFLLCKATTVNISGSYLSWWRKGRQIILLFKLGDNCQRKPDLEIKIRSISSIVHEFREELRGRIQGQNQGKYMLWAITLKIFIFLDQGGDRATKIIAWH